MTADTKRTIGVLAIMLILLAGATATAQDGDVQALAKRLAELRGEVEELSGGVEAKKDDIAAKLRSIRSQKADLEMQIKREQVRLEQLRRTVTEHRERLEAREQTQQALEPAVVAAINQVRATVETSLPFKRAERLDELDKLTRQLDDGLVTPQKAASRLWQFVEDELRLARENGLYRQIVEVDGEEVLADVARLGMVAIYFKTEDGRIGMATRSEAAGPAEPAWQWRELSGEANTERVRHLFESFKKNIRVGYFEIPNALSTAPSSSGGAQ